MNKFFILTISAALFVGVGCVRPAPRETVEVSMAERITFETVDGVTIVGDYYEGGGRTALLLHMRPATRESWKSFAGKLVFAGFSVLAIDLRGHGESTQAKDGRTLDYNRMTEAEERDSIKDVQAAMDWLNREQSVAGDKVALVGASIGANLALQYLSEHREVKTAALLSPGLDYRGIKTEPLVRKLTAPQAIYLIAAEDDEYSAESVRQLAQKTRVPHELKVFANGGHGTRLFESQPTLMDELVIWLQR